jgi:hypothetical protein
VPRLLPVQPAPGPDEYAPSKSGPMIASATAA